MSRVPSPSEVLLTVLVFTKGLHSAGVTGTCRWDEARAPPTAAEMATQGNLVHGDEYTASGAFEDADGPPPKCECTSFDPI